MPGVTRDPSIHHSNEQLVVLQSALATHTELAKRVHSMYLVMGVGRYGPCCFFQGRTDMCAVRDALWPAVTYDFLTLQTSIASMYPATANGGYGQYLTRQEVEKFTRPSDATRAAVDTWLSKHGLTATKASAAPDTTGHDSDLDSVDVEPVRRHGRRAAKVRAGITASVPDSRPHAAPGRERIIRHTITWPKIQRGAAHLCNELQALFVETIFGVLVFPSLRVSMGKLLEPVQGADLLHRTMAFFVSRGVVLDALRAAAHSRMVWASKALEVALWLRPHRLFPIYRDYLAMAGPIMNRNPSNAVPALQDAFAIWFDRHPAERDLLRSIDEVVTYHIAELQSGHLHDENAPAVFAAYSSKRRAPAKARSSGPKQLSFRLPFAAQTLCLSDFPVAPSLRLASLLLDSAIARHYGAPPISRSLDAILNGFHPLVRGKKLQFSCDQLNPVPAFWKVMSTLRPLLNAETLRHASGFSNLLAVFGSGQSLHTLKFLTHWMGNLPSTSQEMYELWEDALHTNTAIIDDVRPDEAHPSEEFLEDYPDYGPIENMRVWGTASHAISFGPNGERIWQWFDEDVSASWDAWLAGSATALPSWMSTLIFIQSLELAPFKGFSLSTMHVANRLAECNLCALPTVIEMGQWIAAHEDLGAFEGLRAIGFAALDSVDAVVLAFNCTVERCKCCMYKGSPISRSFCTRSSCGHAIEAHQSHATTPRRARNTRSSKSKAKPDDDTDEDEDDHKIKTIAAKYSAKHTRVDDEDEDDDWESEPAYNTKKKSKKGLNTIFEKYASVGQQPMSRKATESEAEEETAQGLLGSAKKRGKMGRPTTAAKEVPVGQVIMVETGMDDARTRKEDELGIRIVSTPTPAKIATLENFELAYKPPPGELLYIDPLAINKEMNRLLSTLFPRAMRWLEKNATAHLGREYNAEKDALWRVLTKDKGGYLAIVSGKLPTGQDIAMHKIGGKSAAHTVKVYLISRFKIPPNVYMEWGSDDAQQQAHHNRALCSSEDEDDAGPSAGPSRKTKSKNSAKKKGATGAFFSSDSEGNAPVTRKRKRAEPALKKDPGPVKKAKLDSRRTTAVKKAPQVYELSESEDQGGPDVNVDVAVGNDLLDDVGMDEEDTTQPGPSSRFRKRSPSEEPDVGGENSWMHFARQGLRLRKPTLEDPFA
ncbi:hypothetical protein AURDEDRAFT_128034 [Auricularia subglabra TFB-10046 SS5]|nr:hypothetical protein AURDEDRAFT_128034 [Auricularia subglabra TFB-10046 SS5]